MLILVAFGFVINLLYLVAPLYMLQVFDRVLASQQIETLLLLTLIAAFALLIMGVLEMVRSRIQTRMGNWLDRTRPGLVSRAAQLRSQLEHLKPAATHCPLRAFQNGMGALSSIFIA